MQKNELRSLIKNTLLKIDEQSGFRPALLDQHINAVYEQMFSEMYRNDRREIQKYTRQYSDANGSGTNLVTGYTPTQTAITLPRKGGGLFSFTSAAKNFIITDMQGLDAVNNSWFDTADSTDHYFVAVSGDVIYGNTTIAAADAITYRLIPKFTAFSDINEVLIPYGNEEMLVDRVIDTIRHMPPSDLINDNTI
jgi:hypothetical protein